MCLLTALVQTLTFCLDRYFIKQIANKKLLPSQLKQPECLNFYLYTRYNVAWKTLKVLQWIYKTSLIIYCLYQIHALVIIFPECYSSGYKVHIPFYYIGSVYELYSF